MIKTDELLKLGWALAEEEARGLGAPSIEPEHFLLAALKIADEEFPSQLDKLDIDSDRWKAICKDAVRLRGYLDVLPNKIAEVRRRLRHRLARTANQPIADDVHIHRSRKTLAAFFDAQTHMEGEVLSLLQLMKSMFELEFLEVIDMRWRGQTQTFHK